MTGELLKVFGINGNEAAVHRAESRAATTAMAPPLEPLLEPLLEPRRSVTAVRIQ
jgi:hypothetical protein